MARVKLELRLRAYCSYKTCNHKWKSVLVVSTEWRNERLTDTLKRALAENRIILAIPFHTKAIRENTNGYKYRVTSTEGTPTQKEATYDVTIEFYGCLIHKGQEYSDIISTSSGRGLSLPAWPENCRTWNETPENDSPNTTGGSESIIKDVLALTLNPPEPFNQAVRVEETDIDVSTNRKHTPIANRKSKSMTSLAEPSTQLIGESQESPRSELGEKCGSLKLLTSNPMETFYTCKQTHTSDEHNFSKSLDQLVKDGDAEMFSQDTVTSLTSITSGYTAGSDDTTINPGQEQEQVLHRPTTSTGRATGTKPKKSSSFKMSFLRRRLPIKRMKYKSNSASGVIQSPYFSVRDPCYKWQDIVNFLHGTRDEDKYFAVVHVGFTKVAYLLLRKGVENRIQITTSGRRMYLDEYGPKFRTIEELLTHYMTTPPYIIAKQLIPRMIDTARWAAKTAP